MPELYALPRVVHPCKIDIERCLYDSEDDGDSVRFFSGCFHLAQDPIQDVEAAVRAQAGEVVGVDDSRDSGLAEEEKLWEDAD